MLDNWTERDFWIKVYFEGGPEGMANYCGRIAITDNPKLEKIWDTFVQAYDALLELMPEEDELFPDE